MNLAPVDLVIIAIYAISVLIVARLVSTKPQNTQSYFLADKSLKWWAIGPALIAANFSVEHILGFCKDGYTLGLAIAAYEWLAALAMILVAKYILPIFLKRGIYTVPQFLQQRYDIRVRWALAVFYIGINIFAPLTALLWISATAINILTGMPFVFALLCLGFFSISYWLYGGLRVIAFTGMLHVVVILLGCFLIAGIALDKVAEALEDNGAIEGLRYLFSQSPERFELILSADNNSYSYLPGIWVLVGGIWVLNIWYWGFNQYIIQPALAAKNLRQGQIGIIFAATIKLFIPILVLPGIAAAILIPDVEQQDNIFYRIMDIMPSGVIGIIIAAVLASSISTLAATVNSIATIFTMDLYAFFRKEHNQAKLLKVGRVVAVVAMAIGLIVAKLFNNIYQVLQYLWNISSFIIPGIVAIFILGLYWDKTTITGVLAAAISSVLISLFVYMFFPSTPFLNRMALVFFGCIASGIIVSLWEGKKVQPGSVDLTSTDFSTTVLFNCIAIAVALVVGVLYVLFW